MSEVSIKVEGMSKQYRLGVIGTGTISHDLNRWWASFRGKEDPYLKIGETNDRSTYGSSDYVWALKDINFEVKQGEVLGIIGKNGAGKSTLLKILSRVTGPSEGRVSARGRIGALLEVGTGFHPELTGRENIFLNGAILGMKKREIASKIDEIIDFSGCERYIDTPAKRYSSGMTVRLAFAIAAFLEPEVLIVDEVLAVGDAEFQKKAIGKMKDVSQGEGRTVLFVSHNMASVKSLCTRGLILENGLLKASGNTDDMIKMYLGGDSDYLNYREVNEFNEGIKIISAGIKNIGMDYSDPIIRDKEIVLDIKYENNTQDKNLYWNLKIKDDSGSILVGTNSIHNNETIKEGHGISSMRIPTNFFNDGAYSFDVRLMSKDDTGYRDYFDESDLLMINVLPGVRPAGSWMGRAPEALNPRFDWR